MLYQPLSRDSKRLFHPYNQDRRFALLQKNVHWQTRTLNMDHGLDMQDWLGHCTELPHQCMIKSEGSKQKGKYISFNSLDAGSSSNKAAYVPPKIIKLIRKFFTVGSISRFRRHSECKYIH